MTNNTYFFVLPVQFPTCSQLAHYNTWSLSICPRLYYSCGLSTRLTASLFDPCLGQHVCYLTSRGSKITHWQFDMLWWFLDYRWDTLTSERVTSYGMSCQFSSNRRLLNMGHLFFLNCLISLFGHLTTSFKTILTFSLFSVSDWLA